MIGHGDRVGIAADVPRRIPSVVRGSLALDHRVIAATLVGSGETHGQLPFPHRFADRRLPRARSRHPHGLRSRQPGDREGDRTTRSATSGRGRQPPQAENGDLQRRRRSIRTRSWPTPRRYTVDGRLVDVPVVVLAERDVDRVGPERRRSTLLRAAGADVPAIVWLEDSWNARRPNRTCRRYATPPTSWVARTRYGPTRWTSWPRAWPTRRDHRSTPSRTASDLLQRLSDAGFITIDGDVDDRRLPERTGTRADRHGHRQPIRRHRRSPWRSRRRSSTRAYRPSSPRCSSRRAADDARSAATRSLRSAPTPCSVAAVSTVDDLDLVQGRVASVLALAGPRDRDGRALRLRRWRHVEPAAASPSSNERDPTTGHAHGRARRPEWVRSPRCRGRSGSCACSSSPRCSARRSSATRSRPRTRCRTWCSSSWPRARSSAVLVPTFVTLLERDDDDGDRSTGGRAAGPRRRSASGLLTVVGIVAAPLIARAAHDRRRRRPRSRRNNACSVTYLLRWFLPQIVLYAWGSRRDRACCTRAGASRSPPPRRSATRS